VEKILEAEPDHLEILYLAALVSGGMAVYEKTVRFASRIFEILSSGHFSDKNVLTDDQKYEVCCAWGTALKELGRAEEAEAVFRKAIGVKGEEVNGHLILIRLLFQGRRYAEAGAVLSEALKKVPDAEELLKLTEIHCTTPQTAPIYLKALSEAGKWEEILGVLGKNPHLSACSWAKKFKANALAGRGNWLEAKVYYEEYLLTAPADWEALNELGTTCFRLELFDEAEVCYRKALQTNPAWEEGWRNLSRSLSKLGKLEEARTSLEQYVSRVPEDKTVYGILADLLYEEKEFGRAINFYEDFLRYHPAEKEHWIRLADCYFSLGHPQSALEFYRRAQNLEPASKEIQARIEVASRRFPAAE
jgi:tetratricopeptide (TPR) repeat protein